jgi:hypothetical protein
MFGLRLISKTEKLLWISTIEDLKEERLRLVAEAKHERERAEAILNILLAKTTGMAVAKADAEDTANRQQQDILDLFGSDEVNEADVLEKIQGA